MGIVKKDESRRNEMTEHTSELFGKIAINEEKESEEISLNYNGNEIKVVFHNFYEKFAKNLNEKLAFCFGIIEKYYEVNENVKNILINRFSDVRPNIRLHRKFQWYFDKELNNFEIVSAIKNFPFPILVFSTNDKKEILVTLRYVSQVNDKALGVVLDEELKIVLLLARGYL